jgi:hypothetical protein
MQPELKARLEAEAEKAGRSLNSEIVSRLEQSLSAGPVEAQVVDDGITAYERIAERTVEKLLESERFLRSIERFSKHALQGPAEVTESGARSARTTSRKPARPSVKKA